MKIIVSPGSVTGSIEAPPSKSLTQRLYAAALLHNGRTIIKNAGSSNDEQAALHILKDLGAVVSQNQGYVEVVSRGFPQPHTASIDCGESGLAARLFMPIASLSADEVMVRGRGSLSERPMGSLLSALQDLGVKVKSENEKLPVAIRGELQARPITIDGTLSSQFLSGLLFAFASVVKAPVVISVNNLVSKPYIDLTLDVLQKFGNNVTHKDYKQFLIKPSLPAAERIEVSVEGDWSSAAYWLVAGAIHGDVRITGLSTQSLQADRRIIEVLKDAGANIELLADSIHVCASLLRPFTVDLTDAPDLFPILSVLAASVQGKSQLQGLRRLIHKESNRAASVQAMLQGFGVDFTTDQDSLLIVGTQKLRGAEISGFNDHRIVMAATIGALRADAPVSISGAEAVSKSYPDFFLHAASLGIRLTNLS